MRVFQLTLIFLTTVLGHLTTTAVNKPHSDAFGPTYRGVKCQDVTYLNHILYENAHFACKNGEVNTDVTQNKNVLKNFEHVAKHVALSPDDARNAGELYIAPITFQEIKSVDDLQNMYMGLDRLVLTKNCDIATVMTYTYHRVKESNGYIRYADYCTYVTE